MRSVPFACFLLLSAFGPARAQNASLSGFIEDPSGAAVPHVQIVVRNVETGVERAVPTNAEGVYWLPSLVPGRYTVKVQASGFEPLRANTGLEAGQNARLDFRLVIGAARETVTVEGGAPLVNAGSAAVSTLVTRSQAENMALNGRSFQSLLTLTPGVVLTGSNYMEQGQLSANGQRKDANYFVVDGVSANVFVAGAKPLHGSVGTLPAMNSAGGTSGMVPVDAIQEFRIQTSTFSPEFGHMPGAQIGIVTRSGTNDFHGSLFEYFRNEKLDANDWFVNRDALPKPQLRQNDFGGVVGGPVLAPGYNGRNRTFFFASYEGLRLRQPRRVAAYVPSLASRAAAQGGIRAAFEAYPLPNGPEAGNGYAKFTTSFSVPSNADAGSIRLDHAVNSRIQLSGRYHHSFSNQTQRAGSDFYSPNTLRAGTFLNETLTGAMTWNATAAILNELRLNWSRTETGSRFMLDDFGGAKPPPDSIMFPSFASSADAFSAFALMDGAASILTTGSLTANTLRAYNIVDHVALTRGSHQLKVGFDYRQVSPSLGASKYAQTVVFNDVRQALAGVASSVEFESNASRAALVLHNVSLFVQDTWRVTPRLTLVYGMRWELNPPPSGKDGNDPIPVSGLEGVPAGWGLAPRGTPLWQTTWNNFAPRGGVAYELRNRPGRETVIRAGCGLFYDVGTSSAGRLLNGGAFPIGAKVQAAGVPFPVPDSVAGPPSLTVPPSGLLYSAFDSRLRLPRSYQWNAAVEQALGGAQTFSATYVGAVGRKLLRTERTTTPGNPTFAGVDKATNSGTSDYHALQLQFQRRFARGLQALASYTWAHSLDNASGTYIPAFPSSQWDPGLDRGSSDFDLRHAAAAAASYEVPLLWRHAAARSLLAGWSIDGMLKSYTAGPADILLGIPYAAGLPVVPRADLIPGARLYLDDPSAPGGRRFNRDAFAAPPAGRQGTLGRNVLRGFSMNQLDIAVRRQCKLHERAILQFRAEFFNILNHPNFAVPLPYLPRPWFGEARGMYNSAMGGGGTAGGQTPVHLPGGPRSTQLALKLQF